jgi:hypothetical protein
MEEITKFSSSFILAVRRRRMCDEVAVDDVGILRNFFSSVTAFLSHHPALIYNIPWFNRKYY